jgi:hypothetical protein
MFNDVNRACTRWLIDRGVYTTELGLRGIVDSEARAALAKKKRKRKAIEKFDETVDELSQGD